MEKYLLLPSDGEHSCSPFNNEKLAQRIPWISLKCRFIGPLIHLAARKIDEKIKLEFQLEQAFVTHEEAGRTERRALPLLPLSLDRLK